MRGYKLLSTVVLAVLATSDYALASILAIDYGTEFMKVSLMKPGVPFDVLLNRDSKRKIQSTVGWKGEDRLFGSDAFALATRFPRDSFSALKVLQGQTSDSDAVSFFSTISATDIIESSRKTVSFKRSDESEWSVEELIAMQFAYIRELAESTASERITDVVITVPPYLSQFERQSVLDAIEIAGMKPLALLNDGTAVAVNYAMTRTFPNPEAHIIYDAGTGSIRATVVNFSSAPSDPKAKASKSKGNSTLIEVKGVGYARGVGGAEMDRRLREILIEDFNLKHNKDIRKDARGLAKLWKEAGRVKSMLSLNPEATSTVESLAFDIDYKSKITRKTFEEALADLQPLFTQPITDALKNADLTLMDITSVVFMGGTSRTPIIQQSVRELVGDNKIAQNVNTDEAAVLGAAFYGASISSQFKTKDIRVQDLNPYDIQVSYPAESKIPGVTPRTISTLLFPAGSKTGAKKTLTLKRKDDFAMTLSYKTPEKGVYPAEISQAEIVGVAEALGNLTERGAIEPVVKVTVSLTESGFAVVQDAVAYGEIKDDSIAGKLKGFFGGSSSSEEESSAEPASSTTTETSAAATPSASTDKKKDQSTIVLKVNTSPLSIHPLTTEEKRKSRDRLLAIDQAERAKARREEVRNLFEAYLYRLRDILDGEADSNFILYSKETERKKMSDLLDEAFHWLSESGETASAKDIIAKREPLEAIEAPIQLRHKEKSALPSAIANFEQALLAGKAFLESAHENYTIETESGAPNKYTLKELDDVKAHIDELKAWLKGKSEKQEKLARNDDPVLLSAEVERKGIALQQQVMRLLKRKVPKVKPTTSSTSATATTASESSSVTESPSTTTTTATTATKAPHEEL